MKVLKILTLAGLIVAGLTSFVQAAGSVKGKISFTGAAPAMSMIAKQADPYCAKSPSKDELVVVNPNGTLKNVVVRVIKGAPAAAAPAQPVVILDQNGCSYKPRVVAVMVGQKVQIKNSDPVLHNVHTYEGTATGFNQAMFKGMAPIEKTFKAGATKFKCDVHPWMTAWIVANENPFFAMTGDSGDFTIANLPAGSYTLEAWHEKYGPQTKDVVVAEGQAVDASFSFAAK
ncbi:MAG: carboxypeptidase regulatory-like domain-containing protein [Deltaproteobacteria bacterium]|nr:carboxypeptidase regulatory-like domain-containing protein [Deltaproteobacteria bacterium]